jgi:hypothetical protein
MVDKPERLEIPASHDTISCPRRVSSVEDID